MLSRRAMPSMVSCVAAAVAVIAVGLDLSEAGQPRPGAARTPPDLGIPRTHPRSSSAHWRQPRDCKRCFQVTVGPVKDLLVRSVWLVNLVPAAVRLAEDNGPPPAEPAPGAAQRLARSWRKATSTGGQRTGRHVALHCCACPCPPLHPHATRSPGAALPKPRAAAGLPTAAPPA
jgi:hypothetical protein